MGQRHNVIFTGFVDPAEVYLYQLAADVLVTYYTYDKPLYGTSHPASSSSTWRRAGRSSRRITPLS